MAAPLDSFCTLFRFCYSAYYVLPIPRHIPLSCAFPHACHLHFTLRAFPRRRNAGKWMRNAGYRGKIPLAASRLPDMLHWLGGITKKMHADGKNFHALGK